MDTLLQDLRYGVRTLVRMRGNAIVAVLTLGLGIAATTTVFSVVYAALLRPLPFPEPDRLVILYTTRTNTKVGVQRLRWAPAEIAALDSRMTTLEAIGIVSGPGVAIDSRQTPAEDPNPERVDSEFVSPGYFAVVRATPRIGRVFRADEDEVGRERPVALISTRLWRRRFASDPNVASQTLIVNQVPHTIVGVMPEAFAGLGGSADVWLPRTLAPRLYYADYLTTPQHFINVIGRLKPGVSLAQADAEIKALAPGVVVDDGRWAEPAAWGATVQPLADAHIDATVSRSVLFLLSAAACLLLIACANVTSLLLARAGSRRREIAIRLAIGSGRARLVRQLLTESLLLASLGGACGVVLAAWAVRIVAQPGVIPLAIYSFAQYAAAGPPALDPAVLIFAFAVTFGTSIVCGLAPALGASRTDLVAGLKEGSGAASRGKPNRALSVLVVSEIALAVLLVAGAGLLIRSFAHLDGQRGGFSTDRVVSFWVNPPAFRYRTEDGPALLERLLARLQQIPDVEFAAVNRCTPFSASCARTIISTTGPITDAAHAPGVERHYISADYFRAVGIVVRAGRVLTDRDRAGRPAVTVINETAARRFWPGEDPIGKHVWFGGGGGFTNQAIEVVGVVGDVKYGTVDEAVVPDFYTSYLQFTYPMSMIVVKARRNPAAIVPQLRAVVASVEPGMPIYDLMTLDERISTNLARPRFNAAMLATFAGVALLLAAAGVYGVVAYSVASRQRDLGVRIALGATAGQVAGMVLREGAALAISGAAIGIVAALGLTRLMRSLLYGVEPADPATFTAAAMILVGVALLAAFVPARRASTVDPIVVLRSE